VRVAPHYTGVSLVSADVTTAEGREEPAAIPLSGRERAIVCLVAQGLTNWQIARELLISRHTVAQHIAEMLRRSQARSRSELVARAYSSGLLMTGVWPPQAARPAQ
jgi:DNA-binding CsgD family transcriptional regulator